MKKINYFIFAMIIGCFAILVVISPQSASSQKKYVQTSKSLPDNVSQILKKSCGSCHNAGGNSMAQSVWSISTWDQYNAKKQFKKASAMCRAISNGTMPPASAGKEKKPTADQKDEVCKWATSLKPTK